MKTRTFRCACEPFGRRFRPERPPARRIVVDGSGVSCFIAPKLKAGKKRRSHDRSAGGKRLPRRIPRDVTVCVSPLGSLFFRVFIRNDTPCRSRVGGRRNRSQPDRKCHSFHQLRKIQTCVSAPQLDVPNGISVL